MKTANIDTILVNPREIRKVEKIVASCSSTYIGMITPCVYVPRGKVVAADSKMVICMSFEIGGQDGRH